MTQDAIDVSYLLSRKKGSECEPVEAWQIEAVERPAGDLEHTQWGENGLYILNWFDLGDARSQFYETPLTELPEVEAQASVAERVIGWLMTFAGFPPRYRLVGSPA